MARFSVTLDEEQNRWVERRAEELNGSKTQVISILVDAARDGKLEPSHPLGGAEDNAGNDVHEEVQALKSRIDELEESLQESSGTGSGAVASAPEEGGNHSESRGEPSASTSERSIRSNERGSSNRIEDGPPDSETVEEMIPREADDVVSSTDIVQCWKLLQRRGTASPRAFKRECGPTDSSTGEGLDTWWEEGVKPVLLELPGVEPPEENARFFRYRY